MPERASRQIIANRCAAFTPAVAAAVPGLKSAAVAIVLIDDDPSYFLLTRRATTLRGHGGQWALPGGRCDVGETIEQTALRELHEELGLSLEADAVLGRLDAYPTRSGYLVTPVVIWAGADVALRPNPDEVASVHRVEVRDIVAPDAFDFITIPESDRRVVRFRWHGDYMHAPTAAMIFQFREVLEGRDTRVADLEQPVFAWK